MVASDADPIGVAKRSVTLTCRVEDLPSLVQRPNYSSRLKRRPMLKSDTHLARLAAYTNVIRHGGMAEQVGAICLRKSDLGRAEILLVTTRETGRWTIPKGWPIRGLKSHEAAEREAWEEAGVKGKARKSPVGYFTYLKTLNDGKKIPSLVGVYLVQVKKALTTFPESRERSTEWLSPAAAAGRVQEPELKGLLFQLGNSAAA